MNLGFVGTGAIAEAIVTGLMTSDHDTGEIWLSPRSEAISSRLAKTFDRVHVAADNQDVVDRAGMVFLAIRPQVAEEVTRALRFRDDQHVVSLVAATSLETLVGWIDAPVNLTQAIPLPFVATHNGATPIYPPDDAVARLFNALGKAIEVERKADYEMFGVASALMGAHFHMLEAVTQWLVGNGIPYEQGSIYLRQLFAGLADAAASMPDSRFETLRDEFSTKGGLNEQVYQTFEAKGGTEALIAGLEGILARIRSA